MILIKEGTQQIINMYLELFCSFDDKEYLFSFVDEEIKRGMTVDANFSSEEDESILADYFLSIHPENLSIIFAFENPNISSLVIDAVPERVREKVCFYISPELLPLISIKNTFPPSLKEFLIFRFAENVISRVIRQFYTGRERHVKKLITLSYEEIFSIVMDAGRTVLESRDRASPERNECILCGYLLFAEFITKLENKLQDFIMLKFSPGIQEILRKLMVEKGREREWIRQRSEEIFGKIC